MIKLNVILDLWRYMRFSGISWLPGFISFDLFILLCLMLPLLCKCCSNRRSLHYLEGEKTTVNSKKKMNNSSQKIWLLLSEFITQTAKMLGCSSHASELIKSWIKGSTLCRPNELKGRCKIKFTRMFHLPCPHLVNAMKA